MLNKEQLNIITDTFPGYDGSRNTTPTYRIMFNNKFITTSSGKTVWKRRSDAKHALLHHFNSNIYPPPWPQKLEDSGCKLTQVILSSIEKDKHGRLDVKKFIAKLEELGYVKYVAAVFDQY